LNTPGYEQLAAVLQAAFDQAAAGKGAERHANGLPFHEQRMQTISALLDSDAGMAFQVCKKVTEGMRLPHEARERELLGAINYIAGMVIFHRQRESARYAELIERARDVAKQCSDLGEKWLAGEERIDIIGTNGNDGAAYMTEEEATIPASTFPNTDALVDPTGKPKWDDAPVWANYLTQDSRGVWAFWQKEPKRVRVGWVNDGGMRAEVNSGKIAGDWRESLELAPGLLKTEKQA